MAQHQSRCLIFANQQLKVSDIFLCSCCFRPIATWLSFRCWPTLVNPFTDCFHWAKLPTLFRKFCNNCSVSKMKFLQWFDPSFICVGYFTANQSCSRSNCDYDLKYSKIYYNALLHVNIKILTSIQISSLLCLVYVRGSVLAPFLFAVFLNELSDTCNLDRNRFIVVYTDDILLISPSVVNLENLVHLVSGN